MSSTKATTGNIGTIDAASLTGAALPAISGAALTNIPGVNKGSSDPLISTNPSAVGAAYLNTTTGELFCCTDATAGSNVWVNVGTGTGDIQPYLFQGTVSGYSSGGYLPSGKSNVTDKFSFSSNTTASDHGDLSVARGGTNGHKSTSHGYVSGGQNAAATSLISIEKFSWTSAVNATDVGDLTKANYYGAEASSSTHGYTASGVVAPQTVIEKFAFAASVTSAGHGNIRSGTRSNGGHSSTTDGFSVGGFPPIATIDKYSFASNTTSAGHGNIGGVAGHAQGAQSSSTHGFLTAMSATGGATRTNVIEKFAFSSNTTASDHGDLTRNQYGGTGQSSTTHGFYSGGSEPIIASVDKFSFSSNAGSSTHGNLSQARQDGAMDLQF